MRTSLFSLLLLLFVASQMTAQVAFKVSKPLDISPALAGNFGELRANHFHAGLDLKTGGVEGLDVRAAADGYVSRIRISSYGYGKAVYIDHPEGYTTVYGHLSAFNEAIGNYARMVQYDSQRFEIDVKIPRGALPVERGEVVALSGNSGSSGGPHLHFEVRETTTEVPRNPVLFGHEIPDSKKPVIEAIGVVPLSDSSAIAGSRATQHYRVLGVGTAKLETSGAIHVNGPFGIMIKCNDQQDGASNKNGVYLIKCKVDGEEIASFKADSIPFDQGRYINAMIDYAYYYDNNSRFVRMYRLPGNKLECVHFKQDGILNLSPGTHQVELAVSDLSGNERKLSFEVKSDHSIKQMSVSKSPTLKWNEDYFYESEFAKVHLKAGDIYQDEPLRISEKMGETSSSITFMDAKIPLHNTIAIELKKSNLQSNELICQIGKDDKVIRALSSKKNGDWLLAESKTFGTFKIVKDDQKPSITPINFTTGFTLSQSAIKFTIKDNLSGIHAFRAEVDGQWVLAEYDHKQDLLSIKRIEIKGTGNHRIALQVWDLAGNVSTFEGSFYTK